MKMFINKKGIMKKELLPFTMIIICCKYGRIMSELENIYKIVHLKIYKLFIIVTIRTYFLGIVHISYNILLKSCSQSSIFSLFSGPSKLFSNLTVPGLPLFSRSPACCNLLFISLAVPSAPSNT